MLLPQNSFSIDWFDFKDQALPANRLGGVVDGGF